MDLVAGDSIQIVAKDGSIRSNKVLSVTRGNSGEYNTQLLDSALHVFDSLNSNIYDLFHGKLIYELKLASPSNAQIGEVGI